MTEGSMTLHRHPDTAILEAARILAPVFMANGWHWGQLHTPATHVPTEAEIALHIAHTYRELLDTNGDSMMSGRLRIVVQRARTSEEIPEGKHALQILLEVGDTDELDGE